MLRTCPQCSNEFTRAKRKNKIAHCPHCQTALFYPNGKMKGQTILYADKEDVDYAIRHVCEAHEDFGTYGPNAERYFAYDILFRCKKYLERRGGIAGYDYHRFFRELIDYILSDQWWHDHLKSLLMLKNRIANFAKEFYDLVYARVTNSTNMSITSCSFAGV